MNKSKKICILIAFICMVAVAAFMKHILGEKVIMIADCCFISSNPRIETSQIGKVYFGDTLEIVGKESDGWIKIRCVGYKFQNAVLEGYIPSMYVVNAHQMSLLKSVCPDSSLSLLKHSMIRKGLINYLERNENRKIKSSYSPREKWVVDFGKSIQNPENIIVKNIINLSDTNKYKDCALILKESFTGKRNLLLFHFKDDKYPVLEAERNIQDQGVLIDVIYRKEPSGTLLFDGVFQPDNQEKKSYEQLVIEQQSSSIVKEFELRRTSLLDPNGINREMLFRFAHLNSSAGKAMFVLFLCGLQESYENYDICLSQLYRYLAMKGLHAYIFAPILQGNQRWGNNQNPILDWIQKNIANIDSESIYLIGVCEGADGAFHFIKNRPKMYAGAILCGAHFPDAFDGKETPIYYCIGNPEYPTDRSYFSRMGNSQSIYSYKNWDRSSIISNSLSIQPFSGTYDYEMDSVLQWLFKQKRKEK